jgi:hypothetical protein
MKDKPLKEIACDYYYRELDLVRKRIQELTDNHFSGVPEISRTLEMGALCKREAYYLLQLVAIKGILGPGLN